MLDRAIRLENSDKIVGIGSFRFGRSRFKFPLTHESHMVTVGLSFFLDCLFHRSFVRTTNRGRNPSMPPLAYLTKGWIYNFNYK